MNYNRALVTRMLPVLVAAAVLAVLLLLLLSSVVTDTIASVCAAPAAACCTVAPANAVTTVGIHLQCHHAIRSLQVHNTRSESASNGKTHCYMLAV
jgi:hypothetical protein